jgi:hypothetical protein
MNEKDKFLSDIKNDSPVLEDEVFKDLVDKEKAENPQAEKPTSGKDEEEKPKTRRYRRLEQKMKEIEEMNIALNERVKVLSELEKYQKEHEGDVDPDLVKVFGTTDDGKALTSVFQKKFKEIEERAQEAALSKIQEQEAMLSREDAENSDTIDSAFDSIEEKYGVDLSGSTKQSKDLRNGFLDFIAAVSPKDENGEIVEYADMERSFDTYSQLYARNKPREVSDRQKELASRTMTHSGQSVPESPKGPVTFKTVSRFLDNLRGQ